MAFGLTDRRNVLSEFSNSEKIGEGTYGIVYKATWGAKNMDIALKKIFLDKSEDGIPSTCLREVSILKELKHPNIVTLFDCVINENKLFMVFEYLDNDLKMVLDKLEDQKMPLPYIKACALQLLNGLAYCHVRRIIHRDLKPQNILVADNGTMKLADFGLARSFTIPQKNYTHEVVTLWYRPPEIILGEEYYSCGVDVWSLGCILAECFRGVPLFQGNSEIDQLFKIFKLFGTPNNSIWPGVENLKDYQKEFPKWKPKKISEEYPDIRDDFEDILTKMLSYKPQSRLLASSALNHSFFRDLNTHLPPISSLFKKKSS
uniref:cyclin-dependent kinase n=1 Tax=Strongyloides venezuelensis TaxID=75913 RepID=A0A0K0FKL1_STRVS